MMLMKLIGPLRVQLIVCMRVLVLAAASPSDLPLHSYTLD